MHLVLRSTKAKSEWSFKRHEQKKTDTRPIYVKLPLSLALKAPLIAWMQNKLAKMLNSANQSQSHNLSLQQIA
jgi:hypothetical protein